MSELTVIIPAFNEEKGILETIKNLRSKTIEHDWTILLINDGSTDRTGEIVKGIEGVEVIDHPYNKGYGAALKTGIINARTKKWSSEGK